MPCLVLTGHPCAGKTTFAKLLKERALKHSSGLIAEVVILNEEMACVNQTKHECYATSQAEKATRASLKVELDRQLSSSKTLVIVDSMNYIKGYRYELYCISKAAGEKHGVIWILNSHAQAWNQDNRYPPDLLEGLIQRFEPPDARNRWDQPLYRVDLTPSQSTTNHAAQDALERSVYNMHSLSDAITDSAAAAPSEPKAKSAASSFRKRRPTNNMTTDGTVQSTKTIPSIDKNAAETKSFESTQESATLSSEKEKQQSLEERIDEILDSFLLNVQPLKEGISTASHVAGNANVLHRVDVVTHKVCNTTDRSNTFARTVGLPELKRLRQQYLRFVAQHPPSDTSEKGIESSFIQYIEGTIK